MTDPVKIVGDRCRAPAAASGVTALSSPTAMEPASGLHPDGLQSHGAWRVSCTRRTMDGQRWYRIVGADDWEIAYVPFGDRTSDEYRSCTEHARVIAAAPELYEHLEGAVRALRAFGVNNGGIPAMEAALAKARGDASVGRNAKRHDPAEGRGPQDEHAVGSEADETPNSPSDHPGERA